HVVVGAPGGQGLDTVLGWAGGLWKTVLVVLLALALVVVVDTIVRRRFDLTRDVLVALLVLAGTGAALGAAAESDWFPVERHLLSHWGFPDLRLAAPTAIVVGVWPGLAGAVRGG